MPIAVPTFLTPQQVAKALGLGYNTIYRALSRNEIPHIKIGSRYLINQQWLDAQIEQSTPHAA